MEQRRLDTRGFSLTEQLIVLSVFGVLLASSLPLASSYLRSSRVTGATSVLAADLQHARSLATMKRRTYMITFGATAYSIVQAIPPATIRTRALPPGVVCSASDTATFFPWGLAAPVAITVAGGRSSKTLQLAANGCVTHD